MLDVSASVDLQHSVENDPDSLGDFDIFDKLSLEKVGNVDWLPFAMAAA